MKVRTVIISSVAAVAVGVGSGTVLHGDSYISSRSSSDQKSFIRRSFQRREGFEE